jgi:GT2 family glycosyltransferase
MAKASIIIPTYNRGALLCSTIEMTLQQTHRDCEVIVVDQSPSMETQVSTYIESVRHRVRYLRLKSPNLPGARNAGINAASGEIVLFLDYDVMIGPAYVSSILGTYTNDDIGGVCGVPIPQSCGDYVAESNRVANLLGIEEHSQSGEIVGVKTMMGVNMSFQRRALIEAGLFDEAFAGSGWGEDTDLTMRVRRLGYRFLLNTRINVIHLEPATGGCSNRDVAASERIRKERLLFRLYLLLKHADGPRLDTMQEFYRIYRQYALNKLQLCAGIREFLKRHWEMLNATRAVAAYLAGRRTALL